MTAPASFAACTVATAEQGWAHQLFTTQTSQFTASFTATPSASPTNAVVAFSDGPQNHFNDFATLVRFNPNGNIDARNGNAFAAASTIPYHANTTYTFSMTVDVVAHTYSVYVQVGNNAKQTVGTNFGFRTSQNQVFALDSMGAFVNEETGTLDVCALTVTATAPQIPNPDCTLLLPDNVLTATGLSTPFQLTATNPNNGACNETNAAQSAFAQAAIINTDTGAISIYSPLVIDAGTKPAVAPVVPTLPAHSVVALWFGYNGNNLLLQGAKEYTLENAKCVNGLGRSLFTQFSYCNAPAFFEAANDAIKYGKLTVPKLAKAADGQTCPTVRDFFVVDQDQSDNLPTTYLVTTGGLLAQANKANTAALPGAKAIGNPSDNRLLDVFIDGALNCTPFTAPNLADPGVNVPALALNELQAAADQAAPIALIPANDPMVLDNGKESRTKVNLYRAGVDQDDADSISADANPTTYCQNLTTIQPPRLKLNQARLTAAPSPDAGAANSLFTFMAQRFVASYGLLGCQDLLKKPSPITVTTDANGVAISATIN